MSEKKLLKSIELNDEQFDIFNELFVAQDIVGQLLAVTLKKIAEQQHKDERTGWDELARLAGYDDLRAARVDGKQFCVSWVRRCIDVFDIDNE